MLDRDSGTVLMIVNSVCGCAAGKARPGVVQSLQGEVKPDKVATVFAGADVEATAHLRREKLAMHPPSSPSFALFRDGSRFRHAPPSNRGQRRPTIAAALQQAYARHCVTEPA